MGCKAVGCKTSIPEGIFIMTLLKGWSTKAKEAPSPHEVRLASLDTNPVFQCLGDKRNRVVMHNFLRISSTMPKLGEI